MKTVCPACGAILHLDDSFEGKKVRCDECEEVFVAGRPRQRRPAPVENMTRDRPRPVRRRPARDEEWDEEPQRRRTAAFPVLAVVLGAGILVLLLGVAVVGIFLLSQPTELPQPPQANAQDFNPSILPLDGPANLPPPPGGPPPKQDPPRRPGRPAEQPPAPPQEPPEQNNEVPWQMKPDPVPENRDPVNVNGSVALGGLVVHSTSPHSPFVAISQKDKNRIQVYDLRQMKPVGAVIQGKFDGFVQKLVLSPDGAYFATLLQKVPKETVEVWSVDTGQSLCKIEVDPNPEMKVGALDFAGPGRLLTAKHKGQFPLPEASTTYAVWDVKTGAKVSEFSYDLVLSRKWGEFSPGRKYLVLEQTDGGRGYHLVAWDLTTGKSAGEFAFQGKKDPWGQAAGIAFSPDGEKVAMLWRLSNKPKSWGRLLCWEVKTGRKLVEHNIGYDLNGIDSLWFKGGTTCIQWMPDSSGWLLFGHALVDYETGATVGKVGKEPAWDGAIVDRRFVDRDHLTSVEGGAFNKKLVLVTLPRAEIDAATREARAKAKAAPK
jgi:predicted Zn finger-like uncharacterized protein